MSKKIIMYPISTETGELLDYTWNNYPDDHNGRVQWVENRVFEDELKYAGFHRGRSAAGFDFVSVRDGKQYPMFMTDFDDVLRNCRLNRDRLVGKFTYCKRGANYGVRLLPEDTTHEEAV